MSISALQLGNQQGQALSIPQQQNQTHFIVLLNSEI